jgi:hypothetical protein
MDLGTAAQAYGALIGLDVRFGSLADILRCPSDVGFTPESGHLQCTSACPLWANSGHSDDRVAELVHRDLRTGHTI